MSEILVSTNVLILCSGFLSDRLDLRYFLTVGMIGKIYTD